MSAQMLVKMIDCNSERYFIQAFKSGQNNQSIFEEKYSDMILTGDRKTMQN